MKKLSESIFNAGVERNQGNDIRREDGRKVHTCLGIDIVLQNPNYNFDELIKNLVEGDDTFDTDIDKLSNLSFSPDEIKNIRNFEAPYDYLIYDGQYGTGLVVQFASHYDVNDFMLDDFSEEISEKDYISICKCVATKMKEVGDYFAYLPNRHDCFLITDTSNKDEVGYNRSAIETYKGKYVLKLINEEKVYYWECEREDEDYEYYLNDYKDCMEDEFPELKDEDFICWSYRDGVNIAIPLNINNLNNIKKYSEYTENWFKV